VLFYHFITFIIVGILIRRHFERFPLYVIRDLVSHLKSFYAKIQWYRFNTVLEQNLFYLLSF